MPKLSRRGRRLVDAPPVPEYIVEHFERVGEPWSATDNPSGYIGLCIAENKMQSEELIDQLTQYPVPPRVLGYDAMIGNLEFRGRLARFLERSFLHRRFDPEQVVVLAGAGSVLEMLAYAIANPGDGILVPTPSYAGFWLDLETRDELEVVPVHCSSEDGFRLTPALLDAAMAAASCPIKALLFTTPNNPLGTVYSRDEVTEIVEWAARKNIHLIVDEIYALSVFGTRDFVSVATILPKLGETIHVVWAFSKDFGASGLRCGILISENQEILDAVGSIAYWAVCSGHTQHLLSEFIADEGSVDDYLSKTRSKLRQAYRIVTEALEKAKITYVPAEAAFFVVCDLRKYLEAPTWEAERHLWRHIVERANVNLTPGEACRIVEPGFFRLCYASESSEAVGEAVHRLERVLSR